MVVYMGVERWRNEEDNRKLYKAVASLNKRVGDNKWVIMGDLNGHVELCIGGDSKPKWAVDPRFYF